jgi:hypothetical protein
VLTVSRRAPSALLAAVAVCAMQLASGCLGHRILKSTLERRISRVTARELTIGRITGPLLSGATLHDVTLSDPRGRQVMRASQVSARYSLSTIRRRRPEVELRIDDPDVDLDALIAGRFELGPILRLAEPAEEGARGARALRVNEVVVTRFEVHNLHVHSANTGIQTIGAIDMEGALLVDAQRVIHLTELQVRAPSSSATLSGSLAPTRVDLQVRDLALSPWAMEGVLPAELADTKTAGGLAGEGSAVGPLDAVAVDLRASTPLGPGVVFGTANLTAHRARLRVRVGLGGTRFDATAELALRHVGGGDVELAYTVGGTHPYPGARQARLAMRGRFVLHGESEARFRITLPQPSRSLERLMGVPMAGNAVVLVGRYRKPPRGQAHIDLRPVL